MGAAADARCVRRHGCHEGHPACGTTKYSTNSEPLRDHARFAMRFKDLECRSRARARLTRTPGRPVEVPGQGRTTQPFPKARVNNLPLGSVRPAAMMRPGPRETAAAARKCLARQAVRLATDISGTFTERARRDVRATEPTQIGEM